MDNTSIILDIYNAIKADGSKATLYVASLASYSPSNDSFSGGTISTYPIYTIVTKYTQDEMNDTRIKFGDKKFLVHSYGLPDLEAQKNKVDITLTISGNLFNIISFDKLEPGGVALLYKLQGRG